jgi:hypothetical protein
LGVKAKRRIDEEEVGSSRGSSLEGEKSAPFGEQRGLQ